MSSKPEPRVMGMDRATFYDEAALDKEIHRIFDICHGCRLCFNLCPSFPKLFDFIDATPNESVGELSRVQVREVVDLCYDCKLCFPKCPYTPPHEFELDFPRLMLRAKAVNAKNEGVPLRDKVLSEPGMIGSLGSAFAPFSNAVNASAIQRVVLEKTIGIHRDAPLPVYQKETFTKRWAAHRPDASAGVNGRVGLFYTCSVDNMTPEVGMDAVRVLEHNGVEVVVPPQKCCGIPYMDSGDLDGAAARARDNLKPLAELVRQGFDIVTPGPSCSLMLRQEYPQLIEDADARLVASHTFDLSEYLMKLHEKKLLKTEFPNSLGTIGYHLACHLKAQNIGLRSRDLMRMIPGAEVDTVERCSAHDGTWAMKKEYYDLSMQWGGKLFKGLERTESDTIASDCPLASLQIAKGMGRQPVHPISLIAYAYGLRPDPRPAPAKS